MALIRICIKKRKCHFKHFKTEHSEKNVEVEMKNDCGINEIRSVNEMKLMVIIAFGVLFYGYFSCFL